MKDQSREQFNKDNKQIKNLTLLKLISILQQKIIFINELVNIISKILPYIGSTNQNNQSQIDNYMSVQILFDQFYKLMNSLCLNQQQLSKIQQIYSNCLIVYLQTIEDWIQMNPYILQNKKNFPFFIKLSVINFTLSKNSDHFQKLNSKSNKKNINFLLKDQNSTNAKQFIQLFFKLDHILIQQYLPQLFIKNAQCILELGKIIQFIYLFYTIEEKSYLKAFFDVQKQFQKIIQFVKNEQVNLNTHNSFFNNRFKCRQSNTISQRLKNRVNNKNLQSLKIERDNPYEMFPTTRGVFVKKQLNKYNQQKYMQKQLNDHSKINTQKTKRKLTNFNIEFQNILSQVIERIYQKALFFFQQQSDKQYFKITSQVQISSSNQIQIKNIFTQTFQTFLQKTYKNIVNRNSIISPLNNNFNKSLCKFTNHQRIISSISSTLIGIKKFMLFEQGDFILQFIALVNNLFDYSYNKLSKSLINSYIEQAIKSSSAKDLPTDMIQKVTFIFMKIKTSNSQVKHLQAWSVFSILYKPQFPINCIFTNEIMFQFAQVFNFILKIKKCEYFLKNIWNQFKQDAKIQTQYSLFQTKRHPFQSKILAIRNNIHHFINVVYGYVMIAIQAHWTEYIQQINYSDTVQNNTQFEEKKNKNIQIHNPISLIILTKKLQKNLKNQTIANTTLYNTMNLIAVLLDKLKILMNNGPDTKQWDQIIFKQQLQYISHQFLGIISVAKHIQGIGEAISYSKEV